MSNHLSNRAASIKPSATVAINGKAKQMSAQGIDIINLSVGEPDFDTPDFIKKAGIKAIEAGHTKYTAVDGILPLKEAIAAKFKNENQLSFDLDQIIVSTGAKQGLYNLAQAIINPGDEAIIPAPYWVSYPAMIALAEGEPVIVNTSLENRFKITPQQLAAAITPKTKLLILNSPCNPTGMAYTVDELKALGAVLAKHPQVLISSDDIYEHIFWGDGGRVNILNACPELADRTIVANGVSKSYAMTGWRIGYTAGPKEIIGAMRKIQSHSTSNPASISQYAAVAALTGDQSFLKEMNDTFKERHDFVHKALNDIPGISCAAADGAFYLFPDVSEAIAKLELTDDIALAEKILEEAHIALVPGTAFGAPGFIRLSFANSLDNLKAALERLKKMLEKVPASY